MADNKTDFDIPGTDIDIPADSDVLKSPSFPDTASPDKPDPKVDAANDRDLDLAGNGADKARDHKDQNDDKPKVDETALTDAIRKQAELSAERDAARREADAARAAQAEMADRLRTLGDASTKTYWDKINADRDLISNSLAYIQQEMDQAEYALQRAFDASDAKAVASLQREIATLATKQRDLERGKDAAEAHIGETRRAITEHWEAVENDRRTRKPEPEPKKPQTADDYIAALPSATGDWLKSHKDFVTDPAKHQQFIAFANYYGAKNGKLHTDDFVDALSREFDPSASRHKSEGDMSDDADRTEQKSASRKTATAAPVSRNGNVFSSRNMTGTKIRLPSHIADFVKTSGLDPQKYAEGLVADIKAGKLPKTYLDPDHQHENI